MQMKPCRIASQPMIKCSNSIRDEFDLPEIKVQQNNRWSKAIRNLLQKCPMPERICKVDNLIVAILIKLSEITVRKFQGSDRTLFSIFWAIVLAVLLIVILLFSLYKLCASSSDANMVRQASKQLHVREKEFKTLLMHCSQ